LKCPTIVTIYETTLLHEDIFPVWMFGIEEYPKITLEKAISLSLSQNQRE
jgi:hypothetical protein